MSTDWKYIEIESERKTDNSWNIPVVTPQKEIFL